VHNSKPPPLAVVIDYSRDGGRLAPESYCVIYVVPSVIAASVTWYFTRPAAMFRKKEEKAETAGTLV
jgi:hypothetical protein